MEREKKLDIHNYERRFENYVKNLDKLSPKNKQLLLEFDKHCKLKESLSIARRCKLMNTMFTFCNQYLKKDFDKADIIKKKGN